MDVVCCFMYPFFFSETGEQWCHAQWFYHQGLQNREDYRDELDYLPPPRKLRLPYAALFRCRVHRE